MNVHVFGYTFEVSRFRRYSVQLGFDPERWFEQRDRVDSLRVARSLLAELGKAEAEKYPEATVYGRVFDLVKGRVVDDAQFCLGLDIVQRMTVVIVRR